jgi:hypothetical protein
MTVSGNVVLDSETGSFIPYTGNGTTTFFEFTFDLDPDSEILVFVNGVLDPGDYQVQSNGVRFFVAPANGAQIVLVRMTDVTQLRNWVAFDSFESEKTEAAMDKLIRLKDEGQWRRNMNLYAIQDADSVLIVNDKGTDADVLLWNQDEDEAGVYAANIMEHCPPDGSPTEDADSTICIEITEEPTPPPPEPEDTGGIVTEGVLMTEMNFSSFGNTPATSRSNPLGGQSGIRDFTCFIGMRWTVDDPGPIFTAEMFEMYAARRPLTDQYYFGWRLSDATTSSVVDIVDGTLELGDILDNSPYLNVGDWVCWMFSFKDMHTPDNNRFKMWLVNLTKQVEYDFSLPNLINTGEMAQRHDTERGLGSRMGFLNNRSGDVTGNFGFRGTIGPQCFHFGQALDFDQPSERAKIATTAGFSDHGVGGVNIFGEQAAYYTQDDPNLNTGYLTTGNPAVFNQFALATGIETPPYNFPVTRHSLGDWVYDTIALAEASGDSWLDGQQIFIRQGNQVMLYRAALAVNGYSGLFHKNPNFSVLDQYTNAAFIESFAEGVDPQTWGWTLTTDGVENTDWAVDVQGGRGRIAKLTTDGAVVMESGQVQAGDDTTFAIFDRLDGDNANTTTNQLLRLYSADPSSANQASSILSLSSSSASPISPPADTWGWWMGGSGDLENTTLNHFEEHRLYMYTNAQWTAVWSEIGPMLFGPPRTLGAGPNSILRITCNLLSDASAGHFQFGFVGYGRLTP